MSSVDQILAQASQENPILGALLGVLLDGGRIVSTGDVSENILNMFPGLFFFERRSVEDVHDLAQLTERDLVFIENLSVDQIWNLSKITGAQLVLVAEKSLDATLVDYQIHEKDVRSALMGMGAIWQKLQPFRQSFYLDGPRENAGLFLDRDGVVIKDIEYIHDPNLVELMPDLVSALKKARELNHRIFIITNQSGLGRGMFQWSQYEAVTMKIQELLAREGLFVDRIVKSPFYEKSVLASGLVRKSLRKPRPGMIHMLAKEFRIDLSKSILVGDCARDLMSGALAGIHKVHLLKSSRTQEELKLWKEWPLISRAQVDLKKVEISSLKEIFS
jgi:histidinol-phosphate phosphatase family protein